MRSNGTKSTSLTKSLKGRTKSGRITTFAEREVAERLQIYERLCDVKDTILEKYVDYFDGISQKTKLRKVALAEIICMSLS
jgi:hypothetical protein